MAQAGQVRQDLDNVVLRLSVHRRSQGKTNGISLQDLGLMQRSNRCESLRRINGHKTTSLPSSHSAIIAVGAYWLRASWLNFSGAC